MAETTDGNNKPFYENIVSQYKRTPKPPKAGKEGSENAGRGGERSDRDSRPSRPAPRRDERPGSDSRFQRSDGRAPRSDTRPLRSDNRTPRSDNRPSGGTPRSDNRPLRSDDRPPRFDNRPPRSDNRPSSGAPRSDSRFPRSDSRFPRSDSRPSGGSRYPGVDNRSSNDRSAPRADSRYARPSPDSRFARPNSRPGGENRYQRPDSPFASAREEEKNFAREEAARNGESGYSPVKSHDDLALEAQKSFARSESGNRGEAGRTGGAPGNSRPNRPENGRTAPRSGNSRSDGRSAPRSASSESRSPSESRAPRKPFVAPQEFTPVFGDLPADARKLLEAFPEIVDAVFPLDGKKLQSLSSEIRDLSHELTDERGERRIGYMNEPAVLSAYIRYYMWWNLIRITRLLVSLPIELKDGDAAADLGSGPLTVPIALWITRPDLRDKKITWYCVDISQGALAAGEELFLSLAARTGNEPWQITRIKGESGVSLRRRVALVTSANMFNELFWDNPLPLDSQAMHHAEGISSYAETGASILVIEPGVPRASRFISLMRDSLIHLGYTPVSPCPHSGVCPFPGLRNGKWCHFVFDTADAPAKLHKLSDEAGLAKDRAALSFIFARKEAAVQVENPVNELDFGEKRDERAPSEIVSSISTLFPNLKVRITSDPIRLPDFYTGRYGCSELGMVMLTGTYQAADYLKTCHSGTLLEVPMPDRKHPERDQKTDAIIINLK